MKFLLRSSSRLSVRRLVSPLTTALTLALAACSAGEGGQVTVPCDDTRCNAACVEDGNETGSCRGDMCVCRPPVSLPSGAAGGVSSGGAVRRAGKRFQLDVSVAPVTTSAERTSSSRDLELGIQPQHDPERRPPAP